jgi:jumonji domain-containing protein 2
MQIPCPIKQLASGKAGVYKVDILEARAMSLREFHEVAERQVCKEADNEVIERKFWKSLGIASVGQPPLYGADMVGSLFGEDDASSWNVNKLDSILRLVGNDLPGITCSMLYVGMWRAMFAFHVEDMNLYSINYLHCGASKRWYCIPPEYADRFESLANSYFPDLFQECRQFLRHKAVMISPLKLRDCGIPFRTVVQEAGEFVITSPRAYHAGFNHGFNIAEATNFATERWMEFGRKAKVCQCAPFSVKIDMDYFDTKYRRHIRDKLVEQRSRCDSPENEAEHADSSEQEDIGWLFRCMCGVKCSEEEPSVRHPVGEQFECCECGVWCHVKCIYGESATLDKLDGDAVCHICARINASEAMAEAAKARASGQPFSCIPTRGMGLLSGGTHPLLPHKNATAPHTVQFPLSHGNVDRSPAGRSELPIPLVRPFKKGKILKGSQVCVLPIAGKKIFGVVDAIEDNCARIHFKVELIIICIVQMADYAFKRMRAVTRICGCR